MDHCTVYAHTELPVHTYVQLLCVNKNKVIFTLTQTVLSKIARRWVTAFICCCLINTLLCTQCEKHIRNTEELTLFIVSS